MIVVLCYKRGERESFVRMCGHMWPTPSNYNNALGHILCLHIWLEPRLLFLVKRVYCIIQRNGIGGDNSYKLRLSFPKGYRHIICHRQGAP